MNIFDRSIFANEDRIRSMCDEHYENTKIRYVLLFVSLQLELITFVIKLRH